MGRTMLQVRNRFPAGKIAPPVTTPEPEDRPMVMVSIEWDDGRRTDTAGTALRWTDQAVLVAFSGMDGLGRQEWFAADLVKRRKPIY